MQTHCKRELGKAIRNTPNLLKFRRLYTGVNQLGNAYLAPVLGDFL
jgi:hypothetical protein